MILPGLRRGRLGGSIRACVGACGGALLASSADMMSASLVSGGSRVASSGCAARVV